uniref:Uncharacterized protein n=1 Tax=Oryza meridionalis TaxID=40149 RepID=A0A0E0CT86_9ORYZ
MASAMLRSAGGALQRSISHCSYHVHLSRKLMDCSHRLSTAGRAESAQPNKQHLCSYLEQDDLLEYKRRWEEKKKDYEDLFVTLEAFNNMVEERSAALQMLKEQLENKNNSSAQKYYRFKQSAILMSYSFVSIFTIYNMDIFG